MFLKILILWQVAASAKAEPFKVMISGAPASGKGTQCELITQKVSSISRILYHIKEGFLVRQFFSLILHVHLLKFDLFFP